MPTTTDLSLLELLNEKSRCRHTQAQSTKYFPIFVHVCILWSPVLHHLPRRSGWSWCTFVVCWSVSFNLCGPCDASIITLRSWLLLLRWGVSALRWFWLLSYLHSLPRRCLFFLKDIFLDDLSLHLHKALDDLLLTASPEPDLFDLVLSSWVRLSGGDYFSPPLDSSGSTHWNEISLPLPTDVSSRCIFGQHSWHLR
jgi:hypothetical protein